MLNLLEPKHFKCFELLRLPLSNSTVLSGTNADGKSSILQSVIAPASDHATIHEWSDRLVLNWPCSYQVGTVSDIVDQVSSRGRFDIGLSNGEVRCSWRFFGECRDMPAGLVQISIGRAKTFDPLPRMRWLQHLDEVDAARTLAHGI